MIVPQKVSKTSERVEMSSDIAQKVYIEAGYYFQATETLEGMRNKDELFPPVIMNATFACELFSKAILYKKQENEFITKHSLKQLYDMFSADIKDEIKQYFKSITKETLNRYIDEIDELFEVWRYRYEYCKYSTHYSFVLDYMNSLKKVSDRVFESI